MPATRDRWKRIPFTAGVPIAYSADFSNVEFAKLREGLIPEVMEDKWFIYFEEPYLFLHRSWTGLPVYRVQLAASSDGAFVVEALCVAEPLQEAAPEHHARWLDFLISNLLLGKAKPFPIPVGAKRAETGLLQHAFAGTGFPQAYPEGYVRSRKRWWRFWR